MNIDLKLVNRALLDIGQEPLTQDDLANDSSHVSRWAKAFYVEALREALSEVQWTGRKKRIRLDLTRREARHPDYRYAYDLPLDCAKPLELQDNEYFVIEGRLLWTDTERATLLYISDGRRRKSLPVSGASGAQYAVIGGADAYKTGSDYLHGGCGESDFEETFAGSTNAASLSETAAQETAWATEDFPEYNAVDGEPKFWEFVEKTLAAKMSLKISDNPNIHAVLLQEQMLVKEQAIEASRDQSAARRQGRKRWSDLIGVRNPYL